MYSTTDDSRRSLSVDSPATDSAFMRLEGRLAAMVGAGKKVYIVKTTADRVLAAVVLTVGLALVIHSQTFSGFFDESFHLLAVQSINRGEIPYADFFYQHPPLFPYVAAVWTRLTGESWRSVHILSTLSAIGLISLVSVYVRSMVPDSRWRHHSASLAAVFVGLNILIVRFATIGQPYAVCLLLVFGSFMMTLKSVGSPRRAALWAGLCAGGALSGLLLTVPVAPLELLWLIRQPNAAGNRSRIIKWFVSGFAAASVPLLLLFLIAPHAAFFDIIQYHLSFRQWPNSHDAHVEEMKTLSSIIKSPQALLLVALAVVGLRSFSDRSMWRADQRSAAQLCALLAIGLALYSLIPYPTFPQYFIFAVPFVGVLASVGVAAVGARIGKVSPGFTSAIVVVVYLLGLVVSIRRTPFFYDGMFWPGLDKVAAAVNAATPPNGALYADERNLYFAAGRQPIAGIANEYGTRLQVTPSVAANLRVLPLPSLDSMIRNGKFATVVICGRQDDIDSLEVAAHYADRRDFVRPQCSMFSKRRER